MIQEQYWYTDM